MSESAVVVEQTLKKLSPGGEYYHLLGNMLVDDIDNYETNLVRNDSSSVIYLCTVDTFNRKEKDGKKRIIFRGHKNSMEDTVSALINDFKELNKKVEKYLGKQAKVIYVCRTNLEEGASRVGSDSAKQRFETRKAPPILI